MSPRRCAALLDLANYSSIRSGSSQVKPAQYFVNYPNFLWTYLLTPCLFFQRCFDVLLAHLQPSEHPSAAWKILCAVWETIKGNSYKQARALGHEEHTASWPSALPSLGRSGSSSSHLRKCEGPGLIQPLPRTQEALKVLAVLGSRGVQRAQGAGPEV